MPERFHLNRVIGDTLNSGIRSLISVLPAPCSRRPAPCFLSWHQAGGPDEESNGLALCTMHHKLFDRGVFTLSDDLNVMVSDGTKGFHEWVIAFNGKRSARLNDRTITRNRRSRVARQGSVPGTRLVMDNRDEQDSRCDANSISLLGE